MASWQEVSTEAHRRVSRQGAWGGGQFVIFLITVLFCSLQAVEAASHLNVNGSGGCGSAMAGDHLLGRAGHEDASRTPTLRFNRQIERHNKSAVLLIFHKDGLSQPSCCVFPHENILSIPPDPLPSIVTPLSGGPAGPLASAWEVFLFSSSLLSFPESRVAGTLSPVNGRFAEEWAGFIKVVEFPEEKTPRTPTAAAVRTLMRRASWQRKLLSSDPSAFFPPFHPEPAQTLLLSCTVYIAALTVVFFHLNGEGLTDALSGAFSQPSPVLWDPSGLLRADLHFLNSFF